MEDILLVHRKSNRNFGEGVSAPLHETAIFKTCLRKILFCTEMDLNNYTEVIEPEDVILRGEKALSLLLEILCGLHSPIVGETEVFGQFKLFIEDRKRVEDPLFADHQKWLHFVMTEVKKIRSEHLVGIGSQSYGSLLRRHTKELENVTICGSGHLAQEILPWLTHKKSVQIICRDPAKMQSFTEKYDNLKILTYTNALIQGEALVIAAPLNDEHIVELMNKQDNHPHAIYDLRGEENNLARFVASQFPFSEFMGLQNFFSEIEETKKETTSKLEALKSDLLERSRAFMQRIELRPLGWDDICA